METGSRQNGEELRRVSGHGVIVDIGMLSVAACALVEVRVPAVF